MTAYAGQTTTATDFDRVVNPPIAVLQQQTVQSIATGTWGVITFDTEIIDTYLGHSTVTNTSRYTVQLAGVYRIGGRVAFAPNSTGSRGARIHLNGSLVPGAATIAGAGNLHGIPEVSHLMTLAAGDYVEIAGGQNSGGNLSTAFMDEAASMMYVKRVHS